MFDLHFAVYVADQDLTRVLIPICQERKAPDNGILPAGINTQYLAVIYRRESHLMLCDEQRLIDKVPFLYRLSAVFHDLYSLIWDHSPSAFAPDLGQA